VSDHGQRLVLRMIEAVNRRDAPAIKAEVGDDFVLHPLITVWERTYRGHQGIDEWQRDLAALWDQFEIHADRLQGTGDDTVIVVGSWRGTPKNGSASLEGPIAAVVRIAGDKVRRTDVYLNEAEAVRAAGSSQI
jgi:ketosteroid isomerase-like protein